MEIKRISGVISAYSANRSKKVRETEASTSVKNMDRVEFGFEKALQAAKNGIAAEVRADASDKDIQAAKEMAENGVPANELASYILFG
ncbi:MAG: hypothetical protein IJO91_03340 [Oscillospiraceae bacterium]|nr:hypothetical protein [Oscillospiraceae bacterium]